MKRRNKISLDVTLGKKRRKIRLSTFFFLNLHPEWNGPFAPVGSAPESPDSVSAREHWFVGVPDIYLNTITRTI